MRIHDPNSIFENKGIHSTKPTTDMLRWLFFVAISLCSLYLCPINASAQDIGSDKLLQFYDTPIHLFSEHGHYKVNRNLSYLEDKTTHLKLKDLLTESAQKRFSRLASNQTSFSHTSSAYWLRFHVTNMETRIMSWYLSINYPLLDDITIYLVNTNGVQRFEGGDQFPFTKRPINLPNFVYPLQFNPAESATIYIRVASQGSINIPITLSSELNFIEDVGETSLYHGIYYGSLIILILYNLLVFSATRKKSFFFNAYYMSAIMIFMLSMSGHAFQYFWPTSPQWSNLSLPIFEANAMLAVVLFGKSFLQTPDQSSRFNKFYNFFIALSVIAFLLSVTLHYSYAVKANTFLGLCTIIFIYTLGIVRFREGYQAAKTFILAWSIFVVSTCIYAMGAFGVIPDYYANEVVMLTGTSAQIIFLNFALAQQTKELSEQIISYEINAREQLQQEVDERTSQLTDANKKLEKLNTKLEELSIKDDLTQVANRRYFNHMLEQSYAASRRNHENLSLLFIDIDHFKKLNDSLGHQAGDECLIFISSIIHQSLHRPKDFLARYGGEEFAIILPDTDTLGAEKIAEEIVEEIRSTPFLWQEKAHKMTASIGVFSTTPSEKTSLHDYITRADAAMYTAKHSGRDQVSTYLNHLS